MDKFPEAFKRFENDVDVGRFESYRQLTLAFRSWAGQRWKATTKQLRALNAEAENLGFHLPEEYGYHRQTSPSLGSATAQNRRWREEIVEINGKSKVRYRDVKTGRFIKKP